MDKVIEDCVTAGKMLEQMEIDHTLPEPSAPPYCVLHPDIARWMYEHLRDTDGPMPLDSMFSPVRVAIGRSIRCGSFWHFAYAAVLMRELWHHQSEDIPYAVNIKTAGYLIDLLFHPLASRGVDEWMHDNGNKPWNAHLSATDTDDTQPPSRA